MTERVFNLVEKDVSRLLSHRPADELLKLADEIAFRIESGDVCIDMMFMQEVLNRIPNFVSRQPVGGKVKNLDLSCLDENNQQGIAGYTREEESLLEKERARKLEEGEKVFPSKGRDLLRNEQMVSNVTNMRRQPKFFNTVRYGIVWTRYAQTHFDEGNLPPEQVLGYRFTIIYSDLIDKTATPKYRLEPSDSEELILLRFFAPAPYEDLVFKIVNKKWELDRRSGFLCQFEGGVLRLYFNFRKDKYRR
jgi:hypothetical protein